MKPLDEVVGTAIKQGLKQIAKRTGQGVAVASAGEAGHNIGTDLYDGKKGVVRTAAQALGDATGVADVKAGEDAYKQSREQGRGIMPSLGQGVKAAVTSPDSIQGALYDLAGLPRKQTKEQIIHRILNILEEKLEAFKEHLMLEANRNVIKQGRAKIIKARVRGGKIQRRKKLSNVKGYTIRGGKLIRMSPSEKRKRKMGARRAKFKRKAKLARALMKRKRSLRKRAAIGLK